MPWDVYSKGQSNSSPGPGQASNRVHLTAPRSPALTRQILRFSAVLLGILFGREAAAGAPVIEVTPTTLDVPALTLGDQFVTSIKITNLGDALLAVTAITHPPEVELSPAPPFFLAPDSSLGLPLTIHAIDTLNERRELQVESDDPAQPTLIVT
jgi:hypothetical protein